MSSLRRARRRHVSPQGDRHDRYRHLRRSLHQHLERAGRRAPPADHPRPLAAGARHLARTLEAIGHAGIESRVATAYEKWVKEKGDVFRLRDGVDGHHDTIKLRWEMLPAAGGEVISIGFDFLVLGERRPHPDRLSVHRSLTELIYSSNDRRLNRSPRAIPCRRDAAPRARSRTQFDVFRSRRPVRQLTSPHGSRRTMPRSRTCLTFAIVDRGVVAGAVTLKGLDAARQLRRAGVLGRAGPSRRRVFSNSRLQFANFALTDAWFAGGIEWNLGSTGHSATTCRPVYAGSVPSSRGTALRIWEWERTRDLVFSVDLLMPADRRLLLAFVRVRNPDPEPKPLYWWTNIAAPEAPGVRVLALRLEPGGPGTTEPSQASTSPSPTTTRPPMPAIRSRSSEPLIFFQVAADRRPWIAAVQADGSGLLQTSIARLRGRKLFCSGTAAGGRRWQEWLCGPGSRYLEIQAGLATTQLEHLRLKASAEISWAEAYAPIDGAPGACRFWSAAHAEVAERMARAIPEGDSRMASLVASRGGRDGAAATDGRYRRRGG